MSSWKNQQEGGYGSIYRPDNITVDIGTDWKLTLEGTLDEVSEYFYYDEDDVEGGSGGTTFFGIGVLTDKDGYKIKFKFWLPYYIFGNLDNPDEFYLDHEPYDQTTLEVFSDYVPFPLSEDVDLVEDELEDDIIYGLYDIVDQNLYKFGYEL